nr:immunoglobulin light chain junction region [Macaca mulatta]MOW69682.1 immunoglobulin light chain junction region [Macaca mulatta]
VYFCSSYAGTNTVLF